MAPFRRQTAKEQLGQVLIQRGIINQAQLKQALQKQKEQGGLLGDILIALGFTQEEDIAQALAIQHDFPYLPLANYEIDAEVTKLVPEELVKKYCVLPVDKMGDILTVVMANPLDTQASEEIAALTKCKIEVFVSTTTEIKKAIQQAYSPNKTPDKEET
jgi:type IV pilus assembly protein PilB